MENSHNKWPWWRWILTGLNMIALVLSAILCWHYLQGGSMPGCGGGSGCEQVLNSPWSAIAGIPVSGLAMGAYLALLVAGFFIGPGVDPSIRRLAWSVMLILCGAIVGSAIWFIIVQKWYIGSFCRYCIATHITGLLLSALICWRAFFAFRHDPGVKFPLFKTIGFAGIGLILAGGIAICQIKFTSPANFSTGYTENRLSPIDYKTAPMIGDPDALYKVTMLFDYKCLHCKKVHIMLEEVVKQYENKLAFVLCPTPLSAQCNPYIPHDVEAFKNSCELAKIGMAVWKASHEAFYVFDSWMFADTSNTWQPRELAAARAKAVELIGQDKFDATESDPWIQEYIQNCIQRYGQTILHGKGGVPKLIFGTRWVIPDPKDVNDLIMILQKTLGVPKP